MGHAVSNFPVFLTKDIQSGLWNLSAISSFDAGKNLFVDNSQWCSIFTPSSMKTFPFYLMKSPQDEKSYTMGIDEKSNAFSTSQGQAIFEKSGKASLLLSRVKASLEADIHNDIQTYQFGEKLASLQLIKSINIVVHYADGNVQTLKGLNTIDEARLQQLSNDDLASLHQFGYLLPIHAMLTSIYQLNNLIQLHNKVSGNQTISQVKLESVDAINI